jgi:hypothetical protein
MAKVSESASNRDKTESEGVLDKVARTVGKASGVLVAAASKVLPNSEPKKRSEGSAKSRVQSSGVRKQSVAKRQKRKAHKRKLKGSSTKG